MEPSNLLQAAGFLAAGFAALVLLGAKSAIHEIEAFILFAVAAILLGSSAIVKAVDRLREEARADPPRTAPDSDEGLKVTR